MSAVDRTTTHRGVLLLLLAMQLVVLGVVPVLDGARELASLTRVTHVESEGGNDCAPSHNHATCQFCRVAGPQFASPRVSARPLDARPPLSAPTLCVGLVRPAAEAFVAPARAPPLA